MIQLQQTFKVSERRACEVVDQPRSSQRYLSQPRSDEGHLTKRMRELVERRPWFGYRWIGSLLRTKGWRVSDARVYRLWCREELKVPRKRRKRRGTGTSENGCQHRKAEHQDHTWCWNFVFDQTMNGSPLKWMSIPGSAWRSR